MGHRQAGWSLRRFLNYIYHKSRRATSAFVSTPPGPRSRCRHGNRRRNSQSPSLRQCPVIDGPWATAPDLPAGSTQVPALHSQSHRTAGIHDPQQPPRSPPKAFSFEKPPPSPPRSAGRARASEHAHWPTSPPRPDDVSQNAPALPPPSPVSTLLSSFRGIRLSPAIRSHSRPPLPA